MNLVLQVVALAALCAPASLAQEPSPAEGRAILGKDAFTTPLHSAAPLPDGTSYGIYASGPDYKVSFHDGFVFYPLLGAAHAGNLPLRWTTLEVTVGGTVVATAHTNPFTRTTDRRVEWDHGGFIEAYDVRPEGVEQTFVFPRPLPADGDLVVTGRFDTSLTAPATADAHQDLIFRDDRGEPRVRYGKAFAVDATGARTEVSTRWDGARVQLRIPGAFVGRAVYPLTLDPLTSSVSVDTGTAPVVDLDIVRDPTRTTASMLVVFSRVFAGNDADGYAIVVDADFQNPTLVFSDVNAGWSTKEGQCAFVGNTQKWVSVYEREFPAAQTSSILVYLHDQNGGGTNTGTPLTLSKPAGSTARNPDVSGRYSGGGNNCFVVYQTDQTTTQANTMHTEAWGVLVNTATGVEASTPTTLDWTPVGTTYDREHPTVVKMHGAPSFWIVAWHELHIPSVMAGGDDWDLNVTRISYGGSKQAQRYRFGPGAHPWNKRYPQLDGSNDRYMLTYVFGPNGATPTGQEIHTQRFDWPSGSFDPVMFTEKTLIADPTNPDYAFPRIAVDSNTASHWTITYQRGIPGAILAKRVGYQGLPTETRTIFASATEWAVGAAVTFSPENGGSFPVVYATDEPGDPVYGVALEYSAFAVNATYGTGCGAGSISASPPYRGHQLFTVALDSAPASQPALLGVSAGMNNLSLAAVPMPGCFLNISAPSVWLSLATDPTGHASVVLPIPEGVPAGTLVFFQWLYFGSPATPVGAATTKGLSSQF